MDLDDLDSKASTDPDVISGGSVGDLSERTEEEATSEA